MVSLLGCMPGVGSISALCCAASSGVSICCSVASCFTCGKTTGAAKLLYLFIFALSAVLGIVMRYTGQNALSSWVSVMNICTNGECYGAQAAYRISGAVFVFFCVMALLTALYRPAHLGAWFLKLLFYIGLLGVTLAIPNGFFEGYAQFARAGSILFLLSQVLIIIDMAYTIHEWLLAKSDALDEDFERQDYEPGLLSNHWKVLYAFLAFGSIIASIVSISVMYKFFGACQLSQFFLSETLVFGVIFTLFSIMNRVGKGLLPPALLWAYNVYLCYGAITNNPDTACNTIAQTENQNQASIITGLVIAVISVTWAAYSAAGSIYHSVASDSSGRSGSNEAARAELNAVIVGGDATSKARAGQPKETDHIAVTVANPTASSASASSAAAADDEPPPAALDRRPWLFHIIMALGGLYLAMVVTNWGDPNLASSTTFSGNPEMSTASMWVRIGSQWAIYALYGWTLMAPICLPNRDFS